MSAAAIPADQVAALFRDHKEAIVHFLLQRVKCPDTAQDLSQETYLRLLRKDGLVHTDNLSGYLFRTAERLAIDFVRHNQRHSARQEPLAEDALCPLPQPEDAAIVTQRYRRVLEAIAALPAQCRHILLLRKVDELGYREIADRLGVSEKTVQRQLVKAMLHCHQYCLDMLP
ncbi:sigma-70 family RNA polymerase sigma factor [Methylomonas sp. EFPC3]|uniref:RNA polymerase sigma factor n=1 Tax=Methylomonas TaxID=416 RepID=UPI00112E8F75|nr:MULTISPECIES: sigma-70 family RNA polymerase sigma factor [Methylomonas]TPQ29218.1 RNA polymerase subunit sigma-24 [Methylomonas koyamae]WFP48675.1 sigma-70 family RNA polymerase sigma factor [Methylomonas sp. EFPC3]